MNNDIIDPVINNQKKSLHFLFYFIPVCLLTLAGLINAGYLSFSHHRVYTDINYSSFCAISKSFNCDTVSQSSYSIFFGVPVPVWGVFGYMFLLLLLPYAYHTTAKRKQIWPIFFITASLYSFYSLILSVISSFFIHSYCLMCILSYGINFALMFYSWLIIRRFNDGRILSGILSDITYIRVNQKKITPVFLLFFLISATVFLTFEDYWNMEIHETVSGISQGITEDGHPWIGAEVPEITIVEYTDYLCFQCKKMHFYLRNFVAENSDKIRLVHVNFPLDKEFNAAINEDLHKGAGRMAMLAIYAGMNGHFWEMNDVLFNIDHSEGSISLKDIADKTNFKDNELRWALNNTQIRLLLKKDIAIGIKAGIVGTPTYEIDGKTYAGVIPSDIIEKYKFGKK
ncbi:MAG: thioredoxin domain-containing protein [Desulfobacterales bacterium]|nr:thioredoxin domain-containing protein [Desulfobacterales bacterium]